MRHLLAPVTSSASLTPACNTSNANVYPDFSPPDDTGVLGSTFSPGGKVLVVPLGDSIEFWDAAQGTLRARLMTPEKLHNAAGGVAPMIALDSTGQTIYAVSTSGLTVANIAQPLDQMTPLRWDLSRPSINVRPQLPRIACVSYGGHARQIERCIRLPAVSMTSTVRVGHSKERFDTFRRTRALM